MTTFKRSSLKLVGAAALLSVAFATQALAQAAISEPGAFAFFHPNADVLNAGRSAPAPSESFAAMPAGAEISGMHMSVRPHHAHHAAKMR